MKILKNEQGENIEVVGIGNTSFVDGYIKKDENSWLTEYIDEGKNVVVLRQELRDTTSWWFYWAFHALDLPAGPVTFRFANGGVVGPFGPAVSLDGVNWEWLGASSRPDNRTFIYDNTAGHKKVYFSFCLGYNPRNFDLFIQDKNSPLFHVSTFAVTENKAEIPCAVIGKPGAKHHILLTARHHACEATGNYVMEGFMEHILEGSGFMADRCQVYAVPFIDYDGVVSGDQGKNRFPHDHNRDYLGDSIYASVRAVKEFAARYKDTLMAVLDFHSPWKWDKPGAEPQQNTAFLFRHENDPEGVLLYSSIMRDSYGAHDDKGEIPFFGKTDYSGSEEMGMRCMTGYMRGVAGVPFAASIETPYFGTPSTFTVTAENMRRLGRRYARALDDYLEAQCLIFLN